MTYDHGSRLTAHVVTILNDLYGRSYYATRHQRTVYAANAVLSIVFGILPPVRSAVDFGCGVGTWLSVLRQWGATDLLGLDGPWVQQDLLRIPSADFRETDLARAITLDRQYDLALSLEVAEHIPEAFADTFVQSLVGASDFILFSAAVPNQGGVGHVNEQWPEYWIEKFETRGYAVLDAVRGRIRNDRRIPFWYRQNIFLFVERGQMSSIDVTT